MDIQMLEGAGNDFAPKYIKFFDENGAEIQWEQVTKLNLVRQGDFVAEKFFELKGVTQQQSEEIQRLQKKNKRLGWFVFIMFIVFWLSTFYNSGVLF